MSSVAIFRAGEEPKYLRSVNTPEYEGDPDVLINPDISLVGKVPIRYWKKSQVGNFVNEMSIVEKQAVDDAEEMERFAQADNLSVDAIQLAKALVRAGVVTKTNLITALKLVIQNG